MANKKRNTMPRLEVSYVPSSFPYDAAFHDTATPRSTPRSAIPTF